jgi:hypothetical protein
MDNNFSVAPGDFGRIQSVSAWRAGWLYQGEAVVSERWSTDFSAPLTGPASFRSVLLTAPTPVDAAGLADHRIGVWIPGERVGHPGRDRQAAAQGVREQAATYRTSRNAQLDDLTRALDRRSAADDEQFATNLKFALADAELVTSDSSVEVDSSAVFESDAPADWIAATGATLLNASYASSGAATVDRITVDDVREKVAPWLIGRSAGRTGLAPMPPEALAAGLRQDGQPVEDLIFKLYEGDAVEGDEVHRFLVHDLGYPEYVGAAHLLAAVANTGAEIVWQDAPDAANLLPRLNRFNVDEFDIAHLKFGNIREITAHAGSEWDSAMPFIRAAMPDAMPESHTPVAVQSAEFEVELQRLAARAVMADALVARLMHSLQRPSPVIGLEQLGLLDVLNAGDWRSFFEVASMRFGAASELRELFDLYRRFRTLSVNTSEIEHAWRYLHVADSNEESESRRLPARTLMTRFELHDLIAIPALWPVVFDEFRRWKSGHAAEYREVHEAARIDALSAARLIERGVRLAVATNRLRTLPEVPSQGAAEALDSWDALAGGPGACTLGMNEIDLDSEPYCAECETGFSVPDQTEQVSASVAALETVLSRINGHISAAAVNEILSDQESPEMVKLLRIGEASNINIDRAAAESRTASFVEEYLSQSTDA